MVLAHGEAEREREITHIIAWDARSDYIGSKSQADLWHSNVEIFHENVGSKFYRNAV